jgi:hypothetical protein
MLRDLAERLNYRYQLWLAERLGDRRGAGEPVLPRDGTEPASRMVLRHIFVLLCGIFILTGIGRIAGGLFPSASHGIALAVVVLAVFWCIVGLTTLASESISKRENRNDHNDRI